MDKQIENLTQDLCFDMQLSHFIKADEICDRYYEKAYQMDFEGDCERIEQEKANMLSELLQLYSKFGAAISTFAALSSAVFAATLAILTFWIQVGKT